jgi:hypothetical protein
MIFKELPLEILNKVLDECLHQQTTIRLDSWTTSCSYNGDGRDWDEDENSFGGFDCDKSIEGQDFWQQVL